MKRQYTALFAAIATSALLMATAPLALADDDAPKAAKKDCDLTFNLKGWSAIYKTAKGDGTITCNNGQTANVTIDVHGGGLTFGKSEIFNGKGEISGVRSINDIFGSYVAAEAHAGVVKSATSQILTKGNVSIALAGAGEGVDIGLDFSKFTIENASKAKEKK